VVIACQDIGENVVHSFKLEVVAKSGFGGIGLNGSGGRWLCGLFSFTVK